VHGGKDPREWFFGSLNDAAPVAAFIVLAESTSRDVCAVLYYGALFRGEVVSAGVAWLVWQIVESKKSYQDGYHALDEEEPLPRVQTCNVVHVREDSCSEDAGDDVGDDVSRVLNAYAKG
jgi:hypothetical protein